MRVQPHLLSFILVSFFFVLFVHVVNADDCAAHGIFIGKSVLDSRARQIHYATEDKSEIYVRTNSGCIYRSVNAGRTFTNITLSLPQITNTSLSYSGTDYGVTRITGTGKDGVVYFIGNGFAFWSTRGGDDHTYKLHTLGSNINGTLTGRRLLDLQAHPTNSSYVLAKIQDPVCAQSSNCASRTITQVNAYQGHEQAWYTINNYTFEVSWGGLEDQIFLISAPVSQQVEIQSDTPARSKNFIAASDFGRNTEKQTPPGFPAFTYEHPALYVIGFVEELNNWEAFVSTDFAASYQQIKFNYHGEYQTGLSFYILDSSQNVSFIAVQQDASTSQCPLFQGSLEEPDFSLSLDHIRITEHKIDFYKTRDLPGIYLANRIDLESSEPEADSIQSVITFDKGGLWSPIPLGNSSLNLFINELVQGPISENSAPGLLLAHGTVGTYRLSSPSEIKLFLSRSGGLNWEKVLEGGHKSSMANQGSLIVSIPSSDPTILKYTWDQALNWRSCNYTITYSYVQHIQALSVNSTDLRFLLIVLNEENGQSSMVVHLDFTDTIPRHCEATDYEEFQPTFESFCLLGQARSILRRKRDAVCADFQTHEPGEFYSCPCTRYDYECDGSCFTKRESEDGWTCENICEDTEEDPFAPPKNCTGQFLRTQGYRKIPGDVCEGGLDLNPIQVSCEEANPSVSSTTTLSKTPIPSESTTSTSSATSTASATKSNTRTPSNTASSSKISSPTSTRTPTPSRSESPTQFLIFNLDPLEVPNPILSLTIQENLLPMAISNQSPINETILGGERDIIIQVTQGTTGTTSTVASSLGQVNINTPANAHQLVTIQYDGPDHSSDLTATGLNHFDLSFANQAQSLLCEITTDVTLNFTVSLITSETKFSVLEIQATPDSDRYWIPFSRFRGNFNFQDLGSVAIQIAIEDEGLVSWRGISVWGNPSIAPSVSSSVSPLPSAGGGDILILDDFTTPLPLVVLSIDYTAGGPHPVTDSMINSPVNAVGHERDVVLFMESSLNTVSLSALVVAGRWKVSFPSSAQTTGFSAYCSIQYDGQDRSQVLSASGLGNLDLTSNFANQFHFVIQSEAQATLTVTLYSNGIRSSVPITIRPSGNPVDYFVAYRQFDRILPTSVGAIELKIEAVHGTVIVSKFATYSGVLPSMFPSSSPRSRSSSPSLIVSSSATPSHSPGSPSPSPSPPPPPSHPNPSQSSQSNPSQSQSNPSSHSLQPISSSRSASPPKIIPTNQPPSIIISTESPSSGQTQTGDSLNIILIIILAIVGGLVLICVAACFIIAGYALVKKSRNSRNQDDVYGMLAFPTDTDL